MATEAWTGARYPASSAAPNVPQDIQNVVFDLSDSTCPSFATPAARDTAFSNWQTAGNTAVSGMPCFTRSDGRYWRYDTGTSAWLYSGGNPPPIVACSAGSGWSVVSGNPPGVYRDASGLLHIVGAVSNNTAYNPQDGTAHTMLQLPTGYYPAAPANGVVSVPNPVNAVLAVQLSTSGVLNVTGGTVSNVGVGSGHKLDGFTFHPTYANAVPLP